MSGLSLTPEASGVSSCRSAGTAVTAALAAAEEAPRVLLPDPYLKLQHVNGFTGEAICHLGMRCLFGGGKEVSGGWGGVAKCACQAQLHLP
jgi:hypothetical protein